MNAKGKSRCDVFISGIEGIRLVFEAHYELFRVAVMQLFWIDGSID